MKTKSNGTYRRHITALTAIVLAVATLSGCFWTPEDARDGGITIDINTEAMGASAIDDYDGFFLGYVIADDLLRSDPATLNEAFAEVDAALEEELAFDGDGTEIDEDDFSIEISFPSIQLQTELFTGTSGSSDFRGLRAGADYLVIVIASEWNSYVDGIGFTTTTIRAGESRSVAMDVSAENWAAFETFLQNRYGVDSDLEPGEEPEAEPEPIDIAAIPGVTQPAAEDTPVTAITETDQYTGTVSWSPTPDDGVFNYGEKYTATITLTPKSGYTLTGVFANFFTVEGATVTHDANSGVVTAEFPATAVLEDATIVISGNGYDPSTRSLYYDLLIGEPGIPESVFASWYTDKVVNEDGDQIDESGSRGDPITPLVLESIAVAPGKDWRIMVTTWENRGTTSGPMYFYLSKKLSPEAGGVQTVQFSYTGSVSLSLIGTDFDTYYVDSGGGISSSEVGYLYS